MQTCDNAKLVSLFISQHTSYNLTTDLYTSLKATYGIENDILFVILMKYMCTV